MRIACNLALCLILIHPVLAEDLYLETQVKLQVTDNFPPDWLPLSMLDDKPTWSEFREIKDRSHPAPGRSSLRSKWRQHEATHPLPPHQRLLSVSQGGRRV